MARASLAAAPTASGSFRFRRRKSPSVESSVGRQAADSFCVIAWKVSAWKPLSLSSSGLRLEVATMTAFRSQSQLKTPIRAMAVKPSGTCSSSKQMSLGVSGSPSRSSKSSIVALAITSEYGFVLSSSCRSSFWSMRLRRRAASSAFRAHLSSCANEKLPSLSSPFLAITSCSSRCTFWCSSIMPAVKCIRRDWAMCLLASL